MSLHSPVAGALPIVPSNKPTPHAKKPFTKLSPDKTPTILIPRIPSINNSLDPKNKIMGFAITTIKVKTNAPNKPPNKEAENAALKALAA